MPDYTMTSYDYQSRSFTVTDKCVMVINFLACRTGPYYLIEGAELAEFTTSPPSTRTATVIVPGVNESETFNNAFYNTGLDQTVA